ncbi:DEAD/DEAH box helicase [Deltaproteobacteria bacterium TL4]
MSFQELELSPEVLKALAEMEFDTPSPIQKKVIPVQMRGGDVIGQAQTGTGKTAAFAIPLIEQIALASRSSERSICSALILTPTRELASQVTGEIQRLAKFHKINVVPIYGGTPIEPQIRALRRCPDIVVATPGRALDHVARKTLDLSGVQSLILDEADEMLDMGFIEDILKLIAHLPANRQMLLFSATMPLEIRKMAEQYMNNPTTISVSSDELIVPKIHQTFYQLEDGERFDGLCRILDFHQPEMTIVFCQTKREVDDLHRRLMERHYVAEALHGDFSQYQRDLVMQKFRTNEIDVLIATDLAARGIDVSNVELVVNYNVPPNPETYVHRIGRTGRAGRSGLAVTLVAENEVKPFFAVQKLIKANHKLQDLPLNQELESIRKALLEKRVTTYLSKEECVDFVEMAAQLLEKSSPIELLASTLKLAYDTSSPQLSVDRKHELNAENTGAERGMVRFFLNAGRNMQISAGDIVRSITRKTRIPGNEIGKILMQEEFSFIEVPESWGEHLLETLPTIIIRDTEVVIKPARSRSKITRFDYKGDKKSRSPESSFASQRRFSHG